MKVLMIIDSLNKGGKERRLSELISYFDAAGYDLTVELIVLNDHVEYQQVYNCKNTNVTLLKRKIKKDPRVFLKLWKLCKMTHPDIIHCWGSMPAVYGLGISIFGRIPLCNAMIANSYCRTFSKDWIRAKITFPFSYSILANSRAGLDAFGVKSGKGKVIYNGYNFNRIRNLPSAETTRDHLGIKTPYVVGMVGSFHPRKDYRTFIEAASMILQDRQDITFLCIGDGQELDNMKSLNSTINRFPRHVIFTGKQNQVEELIQVFDVGVLTTNTRIHYEGISNSILEYMAQHKPVIATKGGGTDEIVLHDITGILIDAFDGENLAEKINLLINNVQLAQSMGNKGFERILNEFSIEKMATETWSLYQHNH